MCNLEHRANQQPKEMPQRYSSHAKRSVSDVTQQQTLSGANFQFSLAGLVLATGRGEPGAMQSQAPLCCGIPRLLLLPGIPEAVGVAGGRKGVQASSFIRHLHSFKHLEKQESQISHSLVHTPNFSNSRNWAKPKFGARSTHNFQVGDRNPTP